MGIDPAPTQTAFDVTHNGWLERIHRQVGIFLTAKYARSRGFDAATLRAQGLIHEPPGLENRPDQPPGKPGSN